MSQRDAVSTSFIYDTGAAALVAQWLRENSDRPVVTFDGERGTHGVWGHIRGSYPGDIAFAMDDGMGGGLVAELSVGLKRLIEERRAAGEDDRIGRFELLLRPEDWEIPTTTWRFDNDAGYTRDPEDHTMPIKAKEAK